MDVKIVSMLEKVEPSDRFYMYTCPICGIVAENDRQVVTTGVTFKIIDSLVYSRFLGHDIEFSYSFASCSHCANKVRSLLEKHDVMPLGYLSFILSVASRAGYTSVFLSKVQFSLDSHINKEAILKMLVTKDWRRLTFSLSYRIASTVHLMDSRLYEYLKSNGARTVFPYVDFEINLLNDVPHECIKSMVALLLARREGKKVLVSVETGTYSQTHTAQYFLVYIDSIDDEDIPNVVPIFYNPLVDTLTYQFVIEFSDLETLWDFAANVPKYFGGASTPVAVKISGASWFYYWDNSRLFPDCPGLHEANSENAITNRPLYTVEER